MIASTLAPTLRERLQLIVRSQFTLFLIVGGAAAAVNFVSRIIASNWMSYPVAVVVAFCIGVATAFVLNRLIVFKGSTRPMHHQMTWFLLVNLFGLVQTLGFSVLLAKVLFPRLNFSWHPESTAHMIGIAIPLISSYFGHKYLSFRN
jgi:putative flippase GtrA